MESEMAKIEATAALEAHTKVEAGQGDDHDAGYIISVDDGMAMVAWESGVRTPCPITDLSAA